MSSSWSDRRPARGFPATALALIPMGLLALGCSAQDRGEPSSSADVWASSSSEVVLGGDTAIRFVDATRASGLASLHYPADLRKAKIIGTMGGGLAWGDYDGDGDPDLYVTQGVEKYRKERQSSTCGLLYRNDGARGFVEVTTLSGIKACGWGSGAAFEDIDLDGDLDLFLTFVGDNQLWINRGDGSFEEVASDWGLAGTGYNSGAAFVDFDDDGDLDLYLTRYVDTTIEAEIAWPSLKLRMPEEYPAPDNALFRQEGPAHWVEVTSDAGVADSEGRGLAVTSLDFDLDGLRDLFIANDRSTNTLLRNLGDGSFEDVTTVSGVGVGPDGHWESAMGVAAADLDNNDYPDLLVTNYVTEPNSLFVNLGDFVFADETRDRGLFRSSLPWVGWGAEFVDFDNDGYLDLYVANGHIVPDFISKLGYWFNRNELIEAYTQGGYRQPMLLFRGGEARFEFVDSGEEGLAGRRLAARGSATADVDGDGLLDLFVLSLPKDSPSILLYNRSVGAGHWLAIELRQLQARGGALAYRVRVHFDGTTRSLQQPSGGSYLSSSALPLHHGLGDATKADVELIRGREVRVRYHQLDGDHIYVLR